MDGEAPVCRSQRIRGWWFGSAGSSSSLAQGTAGVLTTCRLAYRYYRILPSHLPLRVTIELDLPNFFCDLQFDTPAYIILIIVVTTIFRVKIEIYI
jgi:hypothetical protein